jgi:two-component system, OmpR family, sensor histidine kinase KdpD
MLTLTSLGLAPFRTDLASATPALLLVPAVVAAGVVGGARPALATAAGAALAYNLAFIHPYGTLKVDALDDYVALGVFLVVALAVGLLVAAQADRRRAAEQREAEVRELYERLQRLTSEREQLAEEAARAHVLERVDEQRAALLRSVSHDLRSPLATIRAVVSDLRDGVAFDDVTRAELLDSVCDEAERLDRLVANLLNLSRIEAGALGPDLQAVDVDELVHERVRRLGGLFTQVRVQVVCPADLPIVHGDYVQLDQVVTNLLENAARHAPAGSTLTVEAAGKDGVVEVSVSDEGVGVPRWDRDRVFEPFRRGEGSASSGIGLAICKAIVEAHGGRISVDDTPGGGATFRFSIPVHPTAVQL